MLFFSYSAIVLHELSHLLAAVFIGLRPGYIALHPFGANLRLSNKIIGSLGDEIILYLAGPLGNILIALVCIIIGIWFRSDWLVYFYWCNISLCLVNLFPALPLDGGVIVKKLLIYKAGYNRALIIMRVFSALAAMLFLFCGIYMVYISRYNYSVLFMSILLLGNIFTQKEKYNISFLHELLFYARKASPGKKAIIRVFPSGGDMREFAKQFTSGSYTIAAVTDPSGKIKEFMTETEIMESLLDG